MSQLATIPQASATELRDLDANTNIDDIQGAERAAIVLLALGEEYGRGVWAAFDDDEIRRIDQATKNGLMQLHPNPTGWLR